MTIYLSRKAQITILLIEIISILKKYLDFANIFMQKSGKLLLKYSKANKLTISWKKVNNYSVNLFTT